MKDRVIDKVYSKEDIRLELKLTTHDMLLIKEWIQ